MTDRQIQNIKVGDVLLSPSGERIVRKVSKKHDRVYSVVMAILRCSWTRRGHTHIDRHRLRTQFKYTGKRVMLRKKIDYDIRDDIRFMNDNRLVDCCEAKHVDTLPRAEDK